MNSTEYVDVVFFKPRVSRLTLFSLPFILFGIYYYVRLLVAANRQRTRGANNEGAQKLNDEELMPLIEENKLSKTQIYTLLTGDTAPSGLHSRVLQARLEGEVGWYYTRYMLSQAMVLLVLGQPYYSLNRQFVKHIRSLQNFQIHFLIIKLVNILNISYNNLFGIAVAGLTVLPALPFLYEIWDQRGWFLTQFDAKYCKQLERLNLQIPTDKHGGISRAEKRRYEHAASIIRRDKRLRVLAPLLDEDIRYYIIDGRLISSSVLCSRENLFQALGDIIAEKRALVSEQRELNGLMERSPQKIELSAQKVAEIVNMAEQPSFGRIVQKMSMLFRGVMPM